MSESDTTITKTTSELDIDGDGKVSEKELSLHERRIDTQRTMAITAMVAMIIAPLILFTPAISVDRVSALSDLIGLFFIAMAGIVGTYMGASAWMSASRK
jgi:hypothetical protein